MLIIMEAVDLGGVSGISIHVVLMEVETAVTGAGASEGGDGMSVAVAGGV